MEKQIKIIVYVVLGMFAMIGSVFGAYFIIRNDIDKANLILEERIMLKVKPILDKMSGDSNQLKVISEKLDKIIFKDVNE